MWSSRWTSSVFSAIRCLLSDERPVVFDTPSAMLPATSSRKTTSAARTVRHERQNLIP
jgi:hypothetical protein